MSSFELHLDENGLHDDFNGRLGVVAAGTYALGIETLAKWCGLKPTEVPLISQITQNPAGAATSPTVLVYIDQPIVSGGGGLNDLTNPVRDLFRMDATQGVGRSIGLSPPLAVTQSLIIVVTDETRVLIQYQKILGEGRWNDALHLLRHIRKVDNEVEETPGSQFFQAGQIDHVDQTVSQ